MRGGTGAVGGPPLAEARPAALSAGRLPRGPRVGVGESLGALREALRADLGFHGADGGYGPHAWHPFPAKFPPQLPGFLIERLSDPGDVVLDPMAGSGTTLVEAARLGRRAVGCDIDPLARMIATAKLTPIDPVAALQAGREALRAAKDDYRSDGDRLRRDLGLRFDAKTREFVDYWFPPRQQVELLALLQRIEQVPEEGMRNFHLVVFSSTIIAKSGGVTLARDLAHTRPHRDLEKTPVSAFAEFSKRLERNAAALDRSGPLRSVGPPALNGVRAASAADTGLPPESVDLIVTSPPYANNAIDYMRAHKFSLVWLGWKTADLAKIRAGYLGHNATTGAVYDALPSRCEETLSALAEHDAKKAKALRRYFGEMEAVIAEMRRVLKKGGAAVIVVGTSVLRGLDVETHRALAGIAERAGFEMAGMGVRSLDRDKRMMPARWGGPRRTQIEERMHDEYVIGVAKAY